MSYETRKNVRNITILLLLAALVWAVPGAAFGGQLIYTIISAVFVVAMIFFGYRLYNQNRTDLLSLDDRMRALLYGSIAVAALVLVATPLLWSSGIGSVAWVILLAASGWGCYIVYRSHRSY